MKTEDQLQRSSAASAESETRAGEGGADGSGAFASRGARASAEAPAVGASVEFVPDDEPSGFQLAYEAYEREVERVARAAA